MILIIRQVSLTLGLVFAVCPWRNHRVTFWWLESKVTTVLEMVQRCRRRWSWSRNWSYISHIYYRPRTKYPIEDTYVTCFLNELSNTILTASDNYSGVWLDLLSPVWHMTLVDLHTSAFLYTASDNRVQVQYAHCYFKYGLRSKI